MLAVVGTDDAVRFFKEATQVLPENKNYVLMVTDDYGDIDLLGDHGAPAAIDERYDSGDATPLDHFMGLL